MIFKFLSLVFLFMGLIIICVAVKQIMQYTNYSNIMGLLQLSMHKASVTTEVRSSFNLLLVENMPVFLGIFIMPSRVPYASGFI